MSKQVEHGPVCIGCGVPFAPAHQRKPWPQRCTACRRKVDAKRRRTPPRAHVCRQCGQTFAWSKPGPRPTLCPTCKESVGSNGAAYVIERKRHWHVSKTYGISRAQADDLMARQRGKCAVCGKTPDEVGSFHVDHDHSCCSGSRACGKCVRGLVCRTCNQAMGLLHDDVRTIERLISYLRLNSKRR